MLMERVVSAMAAEGRPVGLQLGDEVFHLGEHRTCMSVSSSMFLTDRQQEMSASGPTKRERGEIVFSINKKSENKEDNIESKAVTQ
jgi:hypothetical protein